MNDIARIPAQIAALEAQLAALDPQFQPIVGPRLEDQLARLIEIRDRPIPEADPALSW